MTIIYANWGDEDTKRLTDIWKDLDADIVEINKNYPLTTKEISYVKSKMYNELDTLMFCGHGSSSGMWSPNNSTFGYIFTEEDIPYIKAKNIIGIWCHAREFSKINNLRGFYTSMFISNSNEARMCGFYDVNSDSIYNSMTLFCNEVNELLKNNVSLNQWVDTIHNDLSANNDVEKFNYDNLYYKE